MPSPVSARWCHVGWLLAALFCRPAAAVDLLPPADLAQWQCTGQCGSLGAQGDLDLSPFGSSRYGYVTTAGSASEGVSPLQLDPNSRGSGAETNGSLIVSPVFQASAGDRISVQFNYVSTDGKGYDDYAWARVVDANSQAIVAWLFTARSSNSGTRNIVPGDVVDRDAFDPRTTLVNYDAYDFHSKTADDPIDWSPLGGSNGSCWKDNAAGCGYTGWLQSRISFAAAGQYRIEIGVTNWGDGAYDSGLAFDTLGLTAAVPEAPSLGLMLCGLGLIGITTLRRRREAHWEAPSRAGRAAPPRIHTHETAERDGRHARTRHRAG